MEKHTIKINDNFVLEIDENVEVIIDLKNNNVTVRSKVHKASNPVIPFFPHQPSNPEPFKIGYRGDEYKWISPETVWCSSTIEKVTPGDKNE